MKKSESLSGYQKVNGTLATSFRMERARGISIRESKLKNFKFVLKVLEELGL